MTRPDSFPHREGPKSEALKGLLLLLTAPVLKGVLIRGPRGSGKTSMARSIRPLLADLGMPFVEAPASTTGDRLLGGLDWNATLASGERRQYKGLLVRAHGGMMFVDHVNVLPLAQAAQIAGALESGIVRPDDMGAGAVRSTSFTFLGVYDPSDGEVPALLRGCVGLHAEMDACGSVEEREEIAARALAAAPGVTFETARAAACIRSARLLLPQVMLGVEHRRYLCETASRLGVEGNRAESLAAVTARAHAALCGRRVVDEQDVEAAVRLTLLPRAQEECAGAGAQFSRVEPPPAQPHSEKTRPGDSEGFRTVAVDNPAPLLGAFGCGKSSGSAPARRAGRGAEASGRRGAYVRAVETDPGHGVIALDATLRAAAPFQRLRRRPGEPVRIHPGDLRFKEFRQKSGIQIILALDSSGSMAANRIQQAKGAVIRLLRDAYVHRDTVALIGFRGNRAEVLMRPGRSVDLARRALDDLPVGGGTPIAAAILAALDLVRRSDRPALFVLLTDGRPNVSVTGEPVWQELERIAAAARETDAARIVIDTSRSSVASAAARRLAALLDARHVPLPRMEAAPVYRCIAEAAGALR